MFGEGIYLAEDSGKCDQYSEADAGENEELCRRLYGGSHEAFTEPVYYMLVCKVILGKTATTKATPGDDGPCDRMSRPLLLQNRRDLVNVPGSRNVHYHSLLADIPGWRYREFVSFHSERIRPVYLIAYTRGEGFESDL